MYAQHSVINYGKRPTFKNSVAAKVELKVTQIVMYKGSECDENNLYQIMVKCSNIEIILNKCAQSEVKEHSSVHY